MKDEHLDQLLWEVYAEMGQEARRRKGAAIPPPPLPRSRRAGSSPFLKRQVAPAVLHLLPAGDTGDVPLEWTFALALGANHHLRGRVLLRRESGIWGVRLRFSQEDNPGNSGSPRLLDFDRTQFELSWGARVTQDANPPTVAESPSLLDIGSARLWVFVTPDGNLASAPAPIELKHPPKRYEFRVEPIAQGDSPPPRAATRSSRHPFAPGGDPSGR